MAEIAAVGSDADLTVDVGVVVAVGVVVEVDECGHRRALCTGGGKSEIGKLKSKFEIRKSGEGRTHRRDAEGREFGTPRRTSRKGIPYA